MNKLEMIALGDGSREKGKEISQQVNRDGACLYKSYDSNSLHVLCFMLFAIVPLSLLRRAIIE